jgi:hypothetical protein
MTGREEMSRREALGLLSALSLGLTLGCGPAGDGRAGRVAGQLAAARRAGTGYVPKFFTSEEYQTVRVLVDLIIPRDERSGSATDAGVPEFMDFMMMDEATPTEARTAMRGGLAWLDAESHRRFGRRFTQCDGPQHTALLDDIAWPARARAEMSHGVAFFTAFRDLTASGFWSSQMGVKDLQYLGNAFVPEWTGCPDVALRKLGVRYEA